MQIHCNGFGRPFPDATGGKVWGTITLKIKGEKVYHNYFSETQRPPKQTPIPPKKVDYLELLKQSEYENIMFEIFSDVKSYSPELAKTTK